MGTVQMITVKQDLQPNAYIAVFTLTVTANRQAPMKVTSMQAKRRVRQLLLQADRVPTLEAKQRENVR